MSRLAPIRELVGHLRAEGVLPELADGFDRFLAGEADLEEALGLRSPSSQGRSARTMAILAERDRLICEAAAEYFPGLRPDPAAQALHRRWERYAASGWRWERGLDVLPAAREGTVEASFWRLLRLRDFVPSARTVRAILAASPVCSLPEMPPTSGSDH